MRCLADRIWETRSPFPSQESTIPSCVDKKLLQYVLIAASSSRDYRLPSCVDRTSDKLLQYVLIAASSSRDYRLPSCVDRTSDSCCSTYWSPLPLQDSNLPPSYVDRISDTYCSDVLIAASFWKGYHRSWTEFQTETAVAPAVCSWELCIFEVKGESSSPV